MLTGDCKKDFNKWFKENSEYWNISRTQESLIDWLESMPMSMKFGVYQDFFDSKKLSTKIYEPDINCTKWGYGIVYESNLYRGKGGTDSISRLDARINAIKSSNEVYNDRLKRIRFHKEQIKKLENGH